MERSVMVAESLIAEEHSPPSFRRRLRRVGARHGAQLSPLDSEGLEVLAANTLPTSLRRSSLPAMEATAADTTSAWPATASSRCPKRGLRTDEPVLPL